MVNQLYFNLKKRSHISKTSYIKLYSIKLLDSVLTIHQSLVWAYIEEGN